MNKKMPECKKPTNTGRINFYASPQETNWSSYTKQGIGCQDLVTLTGKEHDRTFWNEINGEVVTWVDTFDKIYITLSLW